MSFASPLWLLALAAVPLAVLALLASRRRARRYAVRFPAVSTLQAAASGAGGTWRRFIPAALLLAALAALALALARPHFSYRVAVNQASLMLVTDHSGSMAANDVSPSRLAAAVSAANTFIDQLPAGARVGAVAFSSSPDAAQAPVTAHAAARAIINAQSADGSTDTGDALALALQLLHGGLAKHPPSAIVLLSDGAANAGVNPLSVAREAKHERIPIFTVALGTPNGTLPNPNPFSSPVAVPPDPELMRQIADASGGRAFNAQSADQLSSIYRHLGSQLGSQHRSRDGTYEFAIAGGVLLLFGAAASARWSGMLP
jgi:Ca-activated chloride channel family protein